jgi:hypothetical protein
MARRRNFLTGISRNHHHMERPLRGIRQIRQDRQAIHLGHVDVNDENVGPVLTGLDQDLESGGRSFDIEAHPGTSIGDGPENTGIVVGNENLVGDPG